MCKICHLCVSGSRAAVIYVIRSQQVKDTDRCRCHSSSQTGLFVLFPYCFSLQSLVFHRNQSLQLTCLQSPNQPPCLPLLLHLVSLHHDNPQHTVYTPVTVPQSLASSPDVLPGHSIYLFGLYLDSGSWSHLLP